MLPAQEVRKTLWLRKMSPVPSHHPPSYPLPFPPPSWPGWGGGSPPSPCLERLGGVRWTWLGGSLVGSSKPDCVTGSLARGLGNGKNTVQGRTNLRLYTEMVNIFIWSLKGRSILPCPSNPPPFIQIFSKYLVCPLKKEDIVLLMEKFRIDNECCGKVRWIWILIKS